jgi:hypothetical protein
LMRSICNCCRGKAQHTDSTGLYNDVGDVGHDGAAGRTTNSRIKGI